MWNIKITLISQHLPPQKVFHQSDEPNMVLIHHGREHPESHFIATSIYKNKRILATFVPCQKTSYNMIKHCTGP